MNVFSRRPKSSEPEPQPATVPTSRDPDLGAPPLPPTFTRDTQTMNFGPKPTGPTPPSGTAIPPRPMGAAPSVTTAPRSGTGERRTLVVGRGISLQGTVTEAERLVVEGTVESQMIQATELSISDAGVFRGEVQVEDAEVAGTFDGTLTARGQLVVRATGRVIGVARCRRLMVEEGGQISGKIEMLGDSVTPSAPTLRPSEG